MSSPHSRAGFLTVGALSWTVAHLFLMNGAPRSALVAGGGGVLPREYGGNFPAVGRIGEPAWRPSTIGRVPPEREIWPAGLAVPKRIRRPWGRGAKPTIFARTPTLLAGSRVGAGRPYARGDPDRRLRVDLQERCGTGLAQGATGRRAPQ